MVIVGGCNVICYKYLAGIILFLDMTPARSLEMGFRAAV